MSKTDFEFDDGKLHSMPYYPPRKIIEFEIDDHNAGYKTVSPTIKKICEDYKNICDLHIKIKLNGIADYSESDNSNEVKTS